MARVPYPKKEDLPEDERHIYERMARERGTGHIWLAIANQPKVLDAMVSLANALRNDTAFERRYRELGVLMVGLVKATTIRSYWNLRQSAACARATGKPRSSRHRPTSTIRNAGAALRQRATESGVVSDATWNALRGYFDTRQAMEVVLTVAWYNCVVRILLPFRSSMSRASSGISSALHFRRACPGHPGKSRRKRDAEGPCADGRKSWKAQA